MINPKTLGAEFVTAMRSLPNLVGALGGDATRIQYYTENTTVFGVPTQNNIRLAVLSMPPGSIMIVWQGTRTGRLGTLLMPVHDFSLYLRAPETPSVGYEDLFNWIVNDVPQGSSVKMLHTNIDPDCEPMDFFLPTARRNTVVVGADGSTFECFECAVGLIESVATS
jgi:hypothetical protein